MEKQFKPVPDVEALKYHGTKDKPDIKIFVSHRINQNSVTIDNPFYFNIRCGAKHDKREAIKLLGDDTGKNISDKCEMYGDMTVEYWAFKNAKADYYGMCQNARYFSFSNKTYQTIYDSGNQIVRDFPDEITQEEFVLNKASVIFNEINGTDAILPMSCEVSKLNVLNHKCNTVEEFYKALDNISIKFELVDLLVKTVDKLDSNYSKTIKDYLNSKEVYIVTCYILKKDLFFELCRFKYNVLFELEKSIDMRTYNRTMYKSLEVLGQILTGAYFLNLIKSGNNKIKKHQTIQFISVDKIEENIKPYFPENSIPIVLMSSNYFAPYISGVLQSIVDSACQDYNYDIIILHKDIEEYTRNSLSRIAISKSNVVIRFFNASKLFKNVTLFVSNAEYAEEAYYRLLTPWILMDYNKAIVMDGDTIVKSDISELFNIDLEGNLIGAVEDIVFQGMLNLNFNKDYEYSIDIMKLDDPYAYVNTGVLVMDLSGIRRMIGKEELLEFVGSKKYRIQEQDAINVLFKNKIKHLDLCWNYYIETNTWVTLMLENAPKVKYDLYRAQKGMHGIIHFANRPRPWDEPNMLHAEDYWNSARKTSFYELLLSRMCLAQASKLLSATSTPVLRQSKIRDVADKYLPKGTRRREWLKTVMPKKGSPEWEKMKQIYYKYFEKQSYTA